MTEIKNKTIEVVSQPQQRCEKLIQSCRSTLKPDQFSELMNLLKLVPNAEKEENNNLEIVDNNVGTKKKTEDIIQEKINEIQITFEEKMKELKLYQEELKTNSEVIHAQSSLSNDFQQKWIKDIEDEERNLEKVLTQVQSELNNIVIKQHQKQSESLKERNVSKIVESEAFANYVDNILNIFSVRQVDVEVKWVIMILKFVPKTELLQKLDLLEKIKKIADRCVAYGKSNRGEMYTKHLEVGLELNSLIL